MARLNDAVREHWLNVLAFCAFAGVGFRVWQMPWRWEELTTLVVAFGGLIAVVFSDEWSEYTGRYGMTRDQFRTQPAWFVRISGVGMLGYAMYRAFGR